MAKERRKEKEPGDNSRNRKLLGGAEGTRRHYGAWRKGQKGTRGSRGAQEGP